LNRSLQVDCVSQDDCRSNQIQATGSKSLLLETAVSDFAKAVKEHGTRQRIACFAFVESRVHASAQLFSPALYRDDGAR